MTRARDVANLIGSGNYSSTTFTATAGQTAFTIAHTQGFVQVFMNGLLLDETADYTSNGTAITLTSGAAAGDEIEVVKYNTFSVGDAIPASGGTFTGSIDASAGLITPAGHVIQVKQSVVSNVFSTTAGASYAEMTDFRTAITPTSTTSKILVRGSLFVGQEYYQAKGRILRDSTPIALGDARGDRPQSTWTTIGYDTGASSAFTIYRLESVSFEFLDSPATTSEIIYSLDMGGYSTSITVHLNRDHNDANVAAYNATPISTLTVMEVAQ